MSTRELLRMSIGITVGAVCVGIAIGLICMAVHATWASALLIAGSIAGSAVAGVTAEARSRR